ncbi:Enoyl-[acyl-carrier-protein] reductase [NADH] FabI [Pseudobythopirellula maris]|uniref:Enoyl-[acyl-carrier-protein] reductase [NADH] n=1 Tax=Pseudobythopirellula maris TaxID=2527991 RepID=A0A5C5ZSY6_9BACT|nr:SDR family oxidoreductase [Pseudobythopirellula maris]TWT90609.1 Enoyl-[acyl-carrier-protein] reductase [NADH] FabI [Pseudobythopirellula maris]
MPNDFLQLAGKTVLVAGVANRKSVAWHVARQLMEADCRVLFSVRSPERQEQVGKLVAKAGGSADDVLVCDVEHEDQITRLADEIAARGVKLDGLLHSIAMADYEDGLRPFHETSKRAFLRTVEISCHSLMALASALKPSFSDDASVVTVSISTTTMASENYGYMAPVKAALDSSVVFLAKSFSRDSRVRFNAVGPSLLKTSASAGIPGYVDSYLYAEQATLRGEALRTDEAASTAVFLLSPRSSGINGQKLVVDAGMGANYFDESLVRAVVERGSDAAEN